MRALWLALAIAASGCSLLGVPGRYCPSNAVGIQVSFGNEMQRTDEIAFRIWVDDEPQLVTMGYKRSPGGDDATLEVELKNYDANKFHTVHVIAIAREKGKRLGSYRTESTIGADCTSATLRFDSLSSTYDYCARASDCNGAACPVSGCCSNSSYCL